MPNERISMSKLKQLIGLQASNLSVRTLARTLGLSVGAVSKYLRAVRGCGIGATASAPRSADPLRLVRGPTKSRVNRQKSVSSNTGRESRKRPKPRRRDHLADCSAPVRCASDSRYGQEYPYPHRHGKGHHRLPPIRTPRYINSAFTPLLRSFAHERSRRSALRRASSGPPHQYTMSCTTQHSSQLPRGHRLHPSVMNSCGGAPPVFLAHWDSAYCCSPRSSYTTPPMR